MDLSGYFDTIPCEELMKQIERRVSDHSVWHLVKMWLKAPVEEVGGKDGIKKRLWEIKIITGVPLMAPQ